MRKYLLLACLFLLALLAALPWLRGVERLDLDASARAQAPGQYVALRHGQVHYRAVGPQTGEPVVLVHGFTVPDYVFDGTREALAAAGFRVFSFDLYGRGWSERPDVVYDRPLLAEQVGELMTALGLESAHVIGLSMGGAVAGHFAARHPERVRRLVLIDPLTRPIGISALRWPVLGEWVFGSWLLPKMAGSQGADLVHAERYRDWPERFHRQMQYRGFGRAILSSLRNVLAHPSLPDFATIGRHATPVLLVWGRNDATIPFEESGDVLKAIPGARLLAVDGAGHLAHLDQPGVVEPALVSFLQATEQSAPDAAQSQAR